MGLDGSSPADERHRGFVDALKKHPNIKLLEAEMRIGQRKLHAPKWTRF